MTAFCRVAVHGNRAHVDVTVPIDVPIAALLPEIADAVLINDGDAVRLSRPGGEPFATDATLRAHGVTDGTVLLVSPAQIAIPTPRIIEPLDRIIAEAASHRSWDAERPVWVLVAALLAATAGFLAVPGGWDAPRILLAATATVAAIGTGSRGEAVPVAAGVFAAAAAIAAALAILTPVSLRGLCAIGHVAAVGLVLTAGRTAVQLTGVSRRPGRARQAHQLLAGLVGAAPAIAVSAGVAGLADSSASGGLLGIATAMVLLLRSRHHPELCQRGALAIGGGLGLAVATVGLAAAVPQIRVGLAVVALGFGIVALRSGETEAPRVAAAAWRRGLELFEHVALAAVVPLACWVGDGYAALRGLGLS